MNLPDRQPEKRKELEAPLAAHHADARPPLYPHAMEISGRIDKTTADPFSREDDYVVWPN